MSTRRIPPRHTFHLAVTAPASLSEAEIAALIESITKGTIKPTKTKKLYVKRDPLSTRKAKAAGTFACRRVPNPLWAEAITWPAGVPHVGCGRTFGSAFTRDRHEAGTEWNATLFPHGCLDRILTAELR